MEFLKKYPKTFQWLFLLIVFFALCFAIDVPETYKLAGRQGGLCRRQHRPQGDAATRRLGRIAPALSCRPLEDVRDGADRRHRPARQEPHRPRGRGHAFSRKHSERAGRGR